MTGDVVNDLVAISEEPNVRIMETKALVCDIEPGRRAVGPRSAGAAARHTWSSAHDARRHGFLTDSTLCIGCKACEVACKEWNGIADDGFNWSGNSYDNTGALGHSTWRHVKFVEGDAEPGIGGNAGEQHLVGFSSDVCKHCEVAGCLEACPTGAIVRTEFGGVFVQPDVCNGCGYCVVALPVRRGRTQSGRRPRLQMHLLLRPPESGAEAGLRDSCPTESIKFGQLDELRVDARTSAWKNCTAAAWTTRSSTIRSDTSVGGTHAFFIVRGDPRAYNLPPKPEVPTVYLRDGWQSARSRRGLLGA